MSAESNKDIVRRWITEVWGGGQVELIPELTTPEYVYGNPQDGDVRGEALLRLLKEIRSAFPDMKNTVDEQIADGERVVTRGTTRGTHRGVFGGIPPTGKAVIIPWIVISELRHGRIAREFEIYDGLGLMQQLGAAVPSREVATGTIA